MMDVRSTGSFPLQVAREHFKSSGDTLTDKNMYALAQVQAGVSNINLY